MTDFTQATDEELARQQGILEDEIDANEQENEILQSKLNRIYAEQNRRRSEGK